MPQQDYFPPFLSVELPTIFPLPLVEPNFHLPHPDILIDNIRKVPPIFCLALEEIELVPLPRRRREENDIDKRTSSSRKNLLREEGQLVFFRPVKEVARLLSESWIKVEKNRLFGRIRF